MSKNKLHQLLKISINSDSCQSDDDQYSLIISEGLKDFLALEAGGDDAQPVSYRLKNVVPNRLVKTILKRCKKGGMSRSEFGIALRAVTTVEVKEPKSQCRRAWEAWKIYKDIKKFELLINSDSTITKSDRKWRNDNFEKYSEFDDRGRSWGLYYLNKQQMKMTNICCFIVLARKLGWIDQRKIPQVPHPSEYKWGTPRPAGMDSILRRWNHYERSSDVKEFLERIDVISSVIALIRNKKDINFSSVQEYFLFENAFRNKYESTLGVASVSQILRRFSAGKSFQSRFQDDDDDGTNIVDVMFNVDDPQWIKKQNDIAKFKRGGEKFDNRKLRIKDTPSGQFKKS